MENNVIDARALFAAKRQLTHAYLKTGRLERACPTGGTVARLHERKLFSYSGVHTNRFTSGGTVERFPEIYLHTQETEDWSWLEELK
jgi:hypothetical protein